MKKGAISVRRILDTFLNEGTKKRTKTPTTFLSRYGLTG
jgi:hypothetical protein